MSNSQNVPKKLLIQMSGAPGSGKSTLARLLRPAVDGVVIDHDVLRSSILQLGMISFDQAAKQAYHLQWSLAQDIIDRGLSVIIDSTCNYQEVLTQGSTLAIQNGYTYWHIECRVQDISLLDQRLRSRNPMGSQRPAVGCHPAAAQDTRANEDPQALFTKWMNPYRPNSNAIVVDGVDDPEVVRDQILKQIVVETVLEHDQGDQEQHAFDNEDEKV